MRRRRPGEPAAEVELAHRLQGVGPAGRSDGGSFLDLADTLCAGSGLGPADIRGAVMRPDGVLVRSDLVDIWGADDSNSSSGIACRARSRSPSDKAFSVNFREKGYLQIERGDWLVLPARPDVVFSKEPGAVWERLIARSEGEWTMLPLPPWRA